MDSDYSMQNAIKTTIYAGSITALLILSAFSAAFAQAMSTTDATTSGGSQPDTGNFNLPQGYTIEPVAWNLTAPDSVAFDNEGNMYIAEAGYPFTGLPEVPRILKVDQNGDISVLADIGFNAPIVDIAYHNATDTLFVAHRYKVSTVDVANGTVNDVIIGLRTSGDHHVNQIAFSPDGQRLYFGIGSATNSGVVSSNDPSNLGWLGNQPRTRDIPGGDIVLEGDDFEMPNIISSDPDDNTTTGAFVPFGFSTVNGQEVNGQLRCTSCILSANINGTDLELEGWGMRNPSGLAFNDAGRLFAAVHGADNRGVRPIANDSDKFYEVDLNETAWYGWPDYAGGAQPVTDDQFQVNGSEPLGFLMAVHPDVQEPIALFQPAHTGAVQMDFADGQFGFAGEAFVAQIGATFPPPGQIVGQNVVRVNVTGGNVTDFLTLSQPDTSFRPTDIVFHQDEGNNTALYIVDWGNLAMGKTTPGSGVVWKVTKSADTAAEPTPPPPINQTTTGNATGSNMTSNATGVPNNATSAGPSVNATGGASNQTETAVPDNSPEFSQ